MNGDVIKEFLVSLGFQVDDPQAIERFAGQAGLAIAGVVAGVAAAAAGMFAFTSQVADEFDALGDLANRVNSTASELQEFGYVATMTGSSVEAANASIERLSSVAGDAAMGMGKGAKVFEQLGINVNDANGQLKNSTDLMWEVGDAIKDMERGQQVAVLKRLGLDPTLVDTLTTSVGGLRDEFKSVYAAVGLDADKAADASGEFMDSLDRLGFVLGAVGKSLAVNFMSRFTDGMNRLRKLIVDNLPKIMNILKPIITLVLNLADVFIALAFRAGQGIGVILGWLGKINDATDGWAGYILAAAAAWKYLNLAFLATPIGMILGLVTAIGLLVDDFMTWKEGGDSFINWDAWSKEIALAESGIGFIRGVLEGWFTFIFGMVDALVKVFSGDFAGAFRAVEIAIEGFLNIGKKALGILKELTDGAIEFAKGVGQDALDAAAGLGNSALDFVGLGAPTPAVAAGMGGGNQSVNQSTQIIVQGSADPGATARAVAGTQNTVNADMARNLKGAAR